MRWRARAHESSGISFANAEHFMQRSSTPLEVDDKFSLLVVRMAIGCLRHGVGKQGWERDVTWALTIVANIAKCRGGGGGTSSNAVNTNSTGRLITRTKFGGAAETSCTSTQQQRQVARVKAGAPHSTMLETGSHKAPFQYPKYHHIHQYV